MAWKHFSPSQSEWVDARNLRTHKLLQVFHRKYLDTPGLGTVPECQQDFLLAVCCLLALGDIRVGKWAGVRCSCEKWNGGSLPIITSCLVYFRVKMQGTACWAAIGSSNCSCSACMKVSRSVNSRVPSSCRDTYPSEAFSSKLDMMAWTQAALSGYIIL